MEKIRLTRSASYYKIFNPTICGTRWGSASIFLRGCFGIFGHGNVAGIGQALHQFPEFPYYQCRNEQAMVHTAVAFTKVKKTACSFMLVPLLLAQVQPIW